MISLAHLALAAVLGIAPPGQAPPSPAPAPAATTAPAEPGSPPPMVPSQPPLPSPSGTPSPVTPTPSPKPSATPAPQPTFGYRFFPHAQASPDPTAPQILFVDLNSRTLHDFIAIRVLTNDAVVKVENHTNGRSDIIPHTGPGEFIAVSKLPKLPFIARGMTVDLQFVAYAADGRKTSVKVPVKLR